MPSGYLGQCDSKEIQMQFSQFSMDSVEMPPIQQLTNNRDFIGADYKTSVGSADVKASILETGLPNNFQGSTGLMRYHSAPSSFFPV